MQGQIRVLEVTLFNEEQGLMAEEVDFSRSGISYC